MDDAPGPLQNLSRDVAMALHPLDVDCGPYRRGDHGYRVHTALMRFSWSMQSVTSKIAELPSGSMRKQARKAHKFLLGLDTSEYRTFAEKHDNFPLAHPQATPEEAKLPLQFIETPGIEYALWPDLYFHSDLCEAVERATDVRRLERQASLQAALDAEESDREEEDVPPQGRHGVQRSSDFTPEGHLRLHHTEDDSDMGIRTYDFEEMDVMKFHQDNMVPNEHLHGRGLLLRYISSYLSKFSTSLFPDLLDDTGSTSYGMAIRILSTYQPRAGDVVAASRAALPAVVHGRYRSASASPVAQNVGEAAVRGVARGLPLARRSHESARVAAEDQRVHPGLDQEGARQEWRR